ncbi:MAG: sigma-70 family RNA polymerase sigma factor [Pyrinomonadaceae bacterium]|nr:sigma-70 family RNA polymerase sigma factor [Pyrinomonadaceae bacterium]
MSSQEDVTELLAAWSNGDAAAGNRLMPLVYDELRRLAGRYLRSERPDHTLQTTALVHEAYLRLIDQRDVQWQNRAHFFAISAQLMRRILVDHARSHHAHKRGGDSRPLPIEEAADLFQVREPEMLALDDALIGLEAIAPRQCRIVELRFFGGLTEKETAHVLGISGITVKRDLRTAKAWLRREIAGATSSVVDHDA